MVNLKSEEEIELIRNSSLLVGKTLAEIANYLKPGVTTKFLDRIAEEYIRANSAIPGFKNYRGYSSTLCISINEQVVHGIPSNREIMEKDIVSIDCGVILDGYYGDSAYTFAVGDVDDDVLKLMRITKEALYFGIEAAVAGNRVGDISYAVQNHVEKHGYSVVRELVGHGLGRKLHEEPQVPNYGTRGSGLKLSEGLVICIEPMINLGKKDIIQEKDGWTIRTKDLRPSAHFEHVIVVRKGKSEVLSTFDYIEKVNNDSIKVIF